MFDFFSRAENLQELTPGWLDFRLLLPPPLTMREGTTIDYRLRLRRFPVRWRSVISRWDPPRGFVDEQVRGPYRSWRHAHRFDPDGDWTRVRDEVDFEVLGGRLMARALVLPDLLRIFHFRQRVLLDRFGGEPGSVSVRRA